MPAPPVQLRPPTEGGQHDGKLPQLHAGAADEYDRARISGFAARGRSITCLGLGRPCILVTENERGAEGGRLEAQLDAEGRLMYINI